jgi:ribosome-associated protein
MPEIQHVEKNTAKNFSLADLDSRILKYTRLAQEKKAENIIVIKTPSLSTYAEYIIICSGHSNRQVQAISDHISETFKKDGEPAFGIEGYSTGQWILVDYADVIIHIFTETIRKYYDLEGMWDDVPMIRIPDAD